MRRRHRVVLGCALAVLLLPVLLLLAILVLANSSTGRGLIEESTARLTQGHVRLAGIGGRFPADLTLRRLELRDPLGLWLAIDGIHLQWAPSALLSDRAEVRLLTAERLDMPRAPHYASDHKPSRAWHWPELRVARLELSRADLGAALTGQPVSFSLTGKGDWSSLQEAQAQMEARRLDSVPSQYRLEARFDARQMSARLDVREDAGGPLAHLAQVPTIGALDVHLMLEGPREAVRARLDLQAGALRGYLTGSIDARSGAADLAVALDSPPLSPRPGIAWQKLHMFGHWQGALDAPSTSAELEAAGFVLPDVQLPALNATLAGQGGILTVDARADGLTLAGRAAPLLAHGPLSAHAVVHLDRKGYPVEFSAAHALASLTGRWRGPAADGEASLSATINDLQPLAALASIRLTGRAVLDAQLRTGTAGSQLKVSSRIAAEGGSPPFAGLLGPQATFEGEARIASGSFDVQRAQLQGQHGEADLRGRIGAGGLDARWQLAVSDLAVLSPRLAGHAAAQGTLRGEAPLLAVTAEADGDVGIGGSPAGALRLTLDARNLPERPEGQVRLQGSLDDAPIVFVAKASAGSGGALRARLEQAHWRSLSAQGELTVERSGSAPSGMVEVQAPHLEDLAHLLAQPLQGAVSARVSFDGKAPGGRATVRLEAHDAGLSVQRLDDLVLTGEVDAVTGTPQLALDLAGHARLADVPASLKARLRGPLDGVALDLQASTEGEESTRSSLGATARADIPSRSVRVDTLQLRYRGEDAHLLEPLTLRLADGLAIDRLRLGVGATELQAHGEITPALSLSASLHDITSELLRPWFPGVRADGRIDVDADLAGTLAAPTGTVRIAGHALRAHSGSVRGLPAGNFTVEAQLQQTVAQVTAHADVADRLALRVDGQAPLTRTAPISLRASGNFDLVLLNPILEAAGQRVRGRAKLDAQVAGTLAGPDAHGSIELSEGDVQDFPRGLHLTGITGRLLADGNQVRLENLIAHAGPGTMTAQGTLGLDDSMPVNVRVEARDARPLASDLITVDANLDLTVSGSLRQRLDAAGTLHVNRADLNIPNALPPSVAVLDVRRAGKPVQPPRTSSFTMGMDLKVDSPRAVFVRGRGLDAELGGALRVGGSIADPLISGGFDMRKGTMNLAGSTLTFTSGRLSFNGQGVRRKIDPTLDFTATNISGGVTYTLHVGGYADAPEITLSSTPEQPQDQILARLLFGADPAQLSTLQIAQIAAALATMSGVGGGGLSPLTALQRKLGLDRLSISGSTSTGSVATAAGTAAQGTSTAASIEAGRYVSSRVFIGARQFTTGTTQAEVQVDLTRSLKIQTTLATGGGTVQGVTPQNDPGSSVGMSYQFEY